MENLQQTDRKALLDLLLWHIEHDEQPYRMPCEDGFNLYARVKKGAHHFLGHFKTDPKSEILTAWSIHKRLTKREYEFNLGKQLCKKKKP